VTTVAELLSNDTDLDGDTLTIETVQDPVNGAVAIVGTDVVFTPDTDYVGAASYTH